MWTSESGDFTPWLAENIDVLADELGLSLTVTGTEVPVGEFRLDIRAEDEEGRTVIIENQLERTDHSHLGQCLVYASGLEASTVVWVSPLFREDFRRSFDWLNERTDLGVRFFGVEVSVVQIGEGGPRAPVFEVVARPNDWQKNVKTAGRSSGAPSTLTPANAQRQEFFAEVLEAVVEQLPAIRMPAPGRVSWLAFASGPFGNCDICVTIDGRLRVEAYVDTGNQITTKALFDEFAQQGDLYEAAAGTHLTWERIDEKRASRIAAYHDIDLDDAQSRTEAKTWAVQSLVRMFTAMNEPLRARAKALKANPPGSATVLVADADSSSTAGDGVAQVVP